MSQQILNQLNTAYKIIKYIHKLYLKYSNNIKYTSFESCGKGVDTIYDIIQTKIDYPILLEIKLHIIKKYDNIFINKIEDILEYVLFLPISIITPIGRWTFINNVEYINKDINLSIELIRNLNLRLIRPSYIDSNNKIHNALFIPIEYIDKIHLDKCINKKRYSTKYLFQIHKYDDIKQYDNDFVEYINKLIIGYKICNYLFNKYLKFIIKFVILDDKLELLKKYSDSDNKELYYNELKKYMIDNKIYGHTKNIEDCIFYLTYHNYFNIIKLS